MAVDRKQADRQRGERNLTLKSVERIAGRIGVEPLALLSPPD